MLTKADNELLSQTGPGTPMGELFRRFWLPALLPSELPHPDSDPIRFRILSEDLIAFRDSNGKVGFVDQHCPHRGASLFFGRNEECGLRCVYHGWKFDVDGYCVDMPNEPAESDFRTKVKAKSYLAAEEYAGLVWIYMGPPEMQPSLPVYQWCARPDADQTVANKWMQESNYAQALEGNIDSSHVGFLHKTFDHPTFRSGGRLEQTQQRTVARETDFGFVYGARRDTSDGQYYWRVTTYAMPTFTQIASQSRAGNGIFLIPRDDESHWWITVTPPRLPDEPERADPTLMGFLTGTAIADPATLGLIPGTWRRVRNKDNDYLLDRQMQRTHNYTGLPGNRTQDQAVTESMGSTVDREKEHLGAADTAIIVMRRYLMRMARQLADGIEPELVQHPELFLTQPMNVTTHEADFQKLWDAHEAEVRSR